MKTPLFLQMFVPQIIAAVLCILLMFSIPVRQKSLLNKSGKCIIPLRRGNATKALSIFAVCFIVIFVTLIRRMNFWGICIICGASVFAAEIAVRNFLLLKNSGIFENGIYLQHPFMLFSDIKAIPALLWEDADISEKLDFEFVMKDSANINIVFYNKEEKDQVLGLLIEKRPDLAEK